MKLFRDLTLVLPHFCNLGMFAEQQKVWASYPAKMRRRLHVIVVDDCSPEGLYPTAESVTVDGLASLRIYRLLEKKRWNWPACRNLGAKVATTEWMLLTDIDHVLPQETLEYLLCGKLHATVAYRFKRVTATQTWPYRVSDQPAYKSHNDTWLMTRDFFYFDDGVTFVGGYDERLSGCYGSSGEFTHRVRAASAASDDVYLDQVMVRYPREIIADASTSPDVYTRKGDPVNDADIRDRKAARDLIAGWRPLHGLVPYTEVYASMVEAVA